MKKQSRLWLDSKAQEYTNNNIREHRTLSEHSSDEDIYDYLEQLNEAEADIKELKEGLKEQLINRGKLQFFNRKQNITFVTTDLKKVPRQFLKLNNTALSSLYKSSLGDHTWLRKYGLKVDIKNTLAFKAIRKKINNES